MRVTLGGADVDLVRRDDVLDQVLRRLSGHRPDRPLCIVSANLDHLYHFGIDSGREGAFDPGRGGADWLVLLDGIPLVWTARRLTRVHWEQLAGSDLLPDLLATAVRARARVGFLGGSSAMQRALNAVLADRFPHLEVAGAWAPTRAEVDDPATSAALAAEIREAGVDLLVLGLGKPRQEEWLLRHGAETGAKVAVAFGAASDFLAGTVDRAPERWRRAGLEWFFRLLREPQRLARRYIIQGPSSLYRLLTQSRTEELADVARQARGAPIISTPAQWRRRLGRLLVAADAMVIALSSAVAYLLRGILGELGLIRGLENELPAAVGVLPLWLGILYAFGCYRPQYLNAGGEGYRRFLAGAFGGLLVLGFVSFALNLDLARGYVGLFFLFVLALGTANRFFIRSYLRAQRRRGRFLQNVLIAGADEEAIEVARAMASAEAAGYRVVGFLDDELDVGQPVIDAIRVVARTGEVIDAAYDARAGLVVVSPTGVRPGTLRDLTVALEGSPVDLAVAPSLFAVVTRRVTVESVANVPVLHVDQIRLEGGKAFTKRALDLIGGSLLLAFFAPVMLIAAAAIKLYDRGPVLFRQTRVGRDGVPFEIWKFRTMVADAEQRLEKLAELNEAGHRFFKIREDPRVTRVGRFLRKWSIDETPQLFNVIRGDMSLVGPRPPVPAEVEKYEPWHLRRLRVRPGITGVWQVSGRSNVAFDEAVRMDLFYIENWSLGYDFYLLAKTVLAVIGREGAY